MTGLTNFNRHMVMLVAFCAACLAIFVWVYQAGGGRLPLAGGYRFHATVPTAVSLAPKTQVRMAGVETGQIETITNRGDVAVLAIRLDEEHAPVYRDARVQVRAKSVIGENYLTIVPGSPAAGALPEGGVLPLRNADESTQLDEILSVFDRRTRGELREMLAGLGDGLSGNGDDLNRLFGSTERIVGAGGPVVQILARQRGQVAGLVDDLGRVMRALGDRSQAIRVLAVQAKATAEAVASRDRRLGETLAVLPSTLRQARATTTRLGEFSPRATPVLADLTRAMAGLEPLVDDLAPTARTARTTVLSLRDFAVRGEPLLRALRTFSVASAQLPRALDVMLAELNPMLGYLAPYDRELAAFFSNLRSSTAYRDATGHLARVNGIYTPDSFAPVNPAQREVLAALEQSGGLTQSRSNGINGYPAPGEIGVPKSFAGRFPRLQALPPVVPETRGR